MSIDIETVRKVANLARLDLKEEELEILSSQMADIVDFVNQLAELDTENVEPYIHTVSETPMREDKKGETLEREKALMNAPEREKGFFVVPRIVEI